MFLVVWIIWVKRNRIWLLNRLAECDRWQVLCVVEHYWPELIFFFSLAFENLMYHIYKIREKCSLSKIYIWLAVGMQLNKSVSKTVFGLLNIHQLCWKCEWFNESSVALHSTTVFMFWKVKDSLKPIFRHLKFTFYPLFRKYKFPLTKFRTRESYINVVHLIAHSNFSSSYVDGRVMFYISQVHCSQLVAENVLYAKRSEIEFFVT